ncbi:hypothetical protein MTO96_032638 [Rhipicephalus appendiculatus]
MGPNCQAGLLQWVPPSSQENYLGVTTVQSYSGEVPRYTTTQYSIEEASTCTILRELALIKSQNEMLLSFLSDINDDESEELLAWTFPLATLEDLEQLDRRLRTSRGTRKQTGK